MRGVVRNRWLRPGARRQGEKGGAWRGWAGRKRTLLSRRGKKCEAAEGAGGRKRPLFPLFRPAMSDYSFTQLAAGTLVLSLALAAFTRTLLAPGLARWA